MRDPDSSDDFLVAFQQATCIVRDLSTQGAGLELGAPDVTVGDTLVIDLNLTEHRRAASIRLHGVVRHAGAAHGGDGAVRAGVEFVDVGNLERALLRRLVDSTEDAHRGAG